MVAEAAVYWEQEVLNNGFKCIEDICMTFFGITHCLYMIFPVTHISPDECKFFLRSKLRRMTLLTMIYTSPFTIVSSSAWPLWSCSATVLRVKWRQM
ncbi:hypothetical protein DFS34DRAFT_613326 [Phlyctochytrium arcticum]|nr:hypothetical protein DFS34DRAFT_613326 [Phlyctochytrium arcticum]